jgi:hypothetical protein
MMRSMLASLVAVCAVASADTLTNPVRAEDAPSSDRGPNFPTPERGPAYPAVSPKWSPPPSFGVPPAPGERDTVQKALPEQFSYPEERERPAQADR